MRNLTRRKWTRITRLLDILEPVHDDQAYASGADAALQRFWERYAGGRRGGGDGCGC